MTGVSNPSLATAPAVAGPPTAAFRAEETFRRIMYAASNSITAAFLKINADRSGFCERAELEAVFTNANVTLSAQELSMLLKRVDTNGDGRVDIRELAKLLHGDSTRFDGYSARGPEPSRKRAR